MGPQQGMSQQVWLFPSRVAWSPPKALLAGFRIHCTDPFPYTAFVQMHACVRRIWKFNFLQDRRRWRLCFLLFLLLYEHCANKTWFLGYYSVITLQTFRIKNTLNQEAFFSYTSILVQFTWQPSSFPQVLPTHESHLHCTVQSPNFKLLILSHTRNNT